MAPLEGDSHINLRETALSRCIADTLQADHIRHLKSRWNRTDHVPERHDAW